MINNPSLWLLLAGAAIYYVLSPLAILLLFRMSADPEIGRLESGGSLPTAAVASYFGAMHVALDKLAFRSVSQLIVRDRLTRMTSYVAVYFSESTCDTAVVAAIARGDRGDKVNVQTQYVEFVTRLGSESLALIQTNNTDGTQAFVQWPHERTIRMPHIVEPAALYRIHQTALSRFAPNVPRINRLLDEYGGDIERYFRDVVIRETLQHQALLGCLYHDESTNCYRPTMKGALLMTLKLIWPIKGLRASRARRDAHRIEAEFIRANS